VWLAISMHSFTTSPARACSAKPLCLAKAQRGFSAPALWRSGEAQVFLHLVSESGAKRSCSPTHRGKTRALTSGVGLLLLLLLLLPPPLLLLLLWLLLCCSARAVNL
jgi:hypothetical protein